MPTSDIARSTEKRKFSVYLTNLFISFVCASLIGVFCVINADRVSNKWCPQCQDTPSTHFYQVFIKARSHHLPSLVLYHYPKVFFFANVNISIFMSFFVSSLFWFFYFTQSKSKLKITHETSFCLILKNLQNAIFHFLFRLIVLVWYQKLGHQWSQTEKMRIIIDQLCIGFQSTTTDLPN